MLFRSKNGQPDLADAKDANASYNLSFVDSNGTLRNYTLILEEADHDLDLYCDGAVVPSTETTYVGGNTTFTNAMARYTVNPAGSTSKITSKTAISSSNTIVTQKITMPDIKNAVSKRLFSPLVLSPPITTRNPKAHPIRIPEITF